MKMKKNFHPLRQEIKSNNQKVQNGIAAKFQTAIF